MSTDVFVARQPIFCDNMALYGYELLYRRSQNNYYEGMDDEQATTELIGNSFFANEFDELIENTKGFINFSGSLLLRDVPTLLPKEKVVVEILERVQATDEIIEKCKELKEMGYILALDDFAFRPDSSSVKLIDYADIIKVEFPKVSVADQLQLISKYRNRITFLAEKVETRQEYQQAAEMGYSLFQGYFFSKPMLVNAKQIHSLDINVNYVLRELNKPEPDFKVISAIIEKDLGLSYKLLKVANSVYFNGQAPIKSIQHALVLLGTKEMTGWVQLMLFKGLRNAENEELIKISVVRGRMLSMIATEMKFEDKAFDCSMAGMLSSIDVILNQSMEKIVNGLALTQEVKDTLLGCDTPLKFCLDSIQAFETGNRNGLDHLIEKTGIPLEKLLSMYIEAIHWARTINY